MGYGSDDTKSLHTAHESQVDRLCEDKEHTEGTLPSDERHEEAPSMGLVDMIKIEIERRKTKQREKEAAVKLQELRKNTQTHTQRPANTNDSVSQRVDTHGNGDNSEFDEYFDWDAAQEDAYYDALNKHTEQNGEIDTHAPLSKCNVVTTDMRAAIDDDGHIVMHAVRSESNVDNVEAHTNMNGDSVGHIDESNVGSVDESSVGSVADRISQYNSRLASDTDNKPLQRVGSSASLSSIPRARKPSIVSKAVRAYEASSVENDKRAPSDSTPIAHIARLVSNVSRVVQHYEANMKHATSELQNAVHSKINAARSGSAVLRAQQNFKDSIQRFENTQHNTQNDGNSVRSSRALQNRACEQSTRDTHNDSVPSRRALLTGAQNYTTHTQNDNDNVSQKRESVLQLAAQHTIADHTKHNDTQKDTAVSDVSSQNTTHKDLCNYLTNDEMAEDNSKRVAIDYRSLHMKRKRAQENNAEQYNVIQVKMTSTPDTSSAQPRNTRDLAMSSGEYADLLPSEMPSGEYAIIRDELSDSDNADESDTDDNTSNDAKTLLSDTDCSTKSSVRSKRNGHNAQRIERKSPLQTNKDLMSTVASDSSATTQTTKTHGGIVGALRRRYNLSAQNDTQTDVSDLNSTASSELSGSLSDMSHTQSDSSAQTQRAHKQKDSKQSRQSAVQQAIRQKVHKIMRDGSESSALSDSDDSDSLCDEEHTTHNVLSMPANTVSSSSWTDESDNSLFDSSDSEASVKIQKHTGKTKRTARSSKLTKKQKERSKHTSAHNKNAQSKKPVSVPKFLPCDSDLNMMNDVVIIEDNKVRKASSFSDSCEQDCSDKESTQKTSQHSQSSTQQNKVSKQRKGNTHSDSSSLTSVTDSSVSALSNAQNRAKSTRGVTQSNNRNNTKDTQAKRVSAQNVAKQEHNKNNRYDLKLVFQQPEYKGKNNEQQPITDGQMALDILNKKEEIYLPIVSDKWLKERNSTGRLSLTGPLFLFFNNHENFFENRRNINTQKDNDVFTKQRLHVHTKLYKEAKPCGILMQLGDYKHCSLTYCLSAALDVCMSAARYNTHSSLIRDMLNDILGNVINLEHIIEDISSHDEKLCVHLLELLQNRRDASMNTKINDKNVLSANTASRHHAKAAHYYFALRNVFVSEYMCIMVNFISDAIDRMQLNYKESEALVRVIISFANRVMREQHAYENYPVFIAFKKFVDFCDNFGRIDSTKDLTKFRSQLLILRKQYNDQIDSDLNSINSCTEFHNHNPLIHVSKGFVPLIHVSKGSVH